MLCSSSSSFCTLSLLLVSLCTCHAAKLESNGISTRYVSSPYDPQWRNSKDFAAKGEIFFKQRLSEGNIRLTTNNFNYVRHGEDYWIRIEFGKEAGYEDTWKLGGTVICIGDYPTAEISSDGSIVTVAPTSSTPLSGRLHTGVFPRESALGAKLIWYCFVDFAILFRADEQRELELPWAASGGKWSRAFQALTNSPETIVFAFSSQRLKEEAVLRRVTEPTSMPHVEGYRLGTLMPWNESGPGSLLLTRYESRGSKDDIILEIVSIAVAVVEPGIAIKPLEFGKPANIVDYRLASPKLPLLNVQYSVTNARLPTLDSVELRGAFENAARHYEEKARKLARGAPLTNPARHLTINQAKRRIFVIALVLLVIVPVVFFAVSVIRRRNVKT